MLLDSEAAVIGWQANSFQLNDADGNTYYLNELMGEKGLVIAFICNHCPYVKSIIERLVADAKVLQTKGINFVAINANDYEAYPEDSPAMMKQFAQQHQFYFPYLIDEDQQVAKSFGAVCTPDFFGLNKKGELQYRGRLDNLGIHGDPSKRMPDLINAMSQIADDNVGPTEQMPSIGCSIKWRK
ncbi:MAG: thioredoxin family protein [Cellvibrionaceae bacterium]